MVEVTAARVKDLREKTGAGMMDCKRALVETAGDLEAAVDWLRKKGLAAASKKTGRVTADGLIGVAISGSRGVLVEVNTETDFVSRNKEFQAFVRNLTGLALESEGDLERLRALVYPPSGRTVADELLHLIATMGENMNLRRAAMLRVGQGVLASYVHNAQGPGLGKIGVIVALESAADRHALDGVARQLAMHVAATSPLVVAREDLSPEVLERERAILADQARQSGKPEAIVAKMVEGRLQRFFEDACLLDQTFVIDNETKISKVLEAAGKAGGTDIRVKGFLRFALGEGIEKAEKDFALEVAEAARR